ncbi:DUF2126 domain-containing protein [Microbulbifer litoralis]|uniref:transglutaminase family protein n=1 Tax=Microbulbifer litoralis TaxID=2933965 RepID=UPI00202825FF|nr:transglutaminase family protein [Microbulbifer sp. GX H0434]
MTTRVALRHTTEYRFDRAVTLAPHTLRLRPTPHARTPVSAYTLRIEPAEHCINWQQDPFGNYQARVVFAEKTERLKVNVEVIAEVEAINPFDFFIEPYAEQFPFSYPEALARDLAPYLEIRERGPLLRQYLHGLDRHRQPLVEFLVALNQRLYSDIRYCQRMDAGVQDGEETLLQRTGSCRDSAWLLVQLLRHLGLAARFASGYLVQLAADEPEPGAPAKDFTDLHAWAEVFVPGAGWVGLDPTSGLLAGEAHIPLACTPSPESAAPVTGSTEPCEVTFRYCNSIERLRDTPRVTRPYSEEQWLAIDALGERIERDLQAQDVRLTMGGEPTFVSADDRAHPQWNTEAAGDEKLSLARELLLRLQRRFAPGAVRQHGHGKSYPGEEAPRWALGCYWLKNGEPLWRDENLLADPRRDYGSGNGDAQRFLQALGAELELEVACILPAFEDRALIDWKRRQLPVDLDPEKLSESDDRKLRQLARHLQLDTGEPAGFVLPLSHCRRGDSWRTERWRLRNGRLTLLLGDAPLGLRLPLAALPGGGDGREPVRTALAVQAVRGCLHVFLPPLQALDAWIELVAAIERVAAAERRPVVLQGYGPPRDPRLQRLLLTPDPGVLEVNIQPAANWREIVDNTGALFEEARQLRLSPYKFLSDGRQVGSGGGNHIALGGATVADSPLLRRPDLLRSLVTCWQRHPSLSYVFSGLFVGPTSQAPRVDQGRDEALYELEIAFRQLRPGMAPEQLDRALRHLFVDITGSRHRSEFCVDKLYPSEAGAEGGRLGVLELRGFEMPPHPRMALVQLLLLRCLVAHFWRRPLQGRLVRWGTQLQDRFLLPHFVWRDLCELCGELNDAGYHFDPQWLRPFMAFRFPRFGEVQLGDLSLELRWAIEPWQVLGESVHSGASARPVDSSMERLQVRLTGAGGDRYLLACNGRRVPLRATGRGDERVAGVRYRAHSLADSLHPEIRVHTPLVFDLVDTWSGRAIGGCTFHSCYPSGRRCQAPPVNGLEAEARRAQRLQKFGHTPGVAENLPPPEEIDDEYPYTLDLRRRPPLSRGADDE